MAGTNFTTLDTECSCGKTTYPSKPDAERAIAWIRRCKNRREVAPCRAYRCPERKGWHITKWQKSQKSKPGRGKGRPDTTP